MKPVLRIALSVLVLVVVAGGSFYGGTVYGKSQAQSATRARFAGAQGGGSFGGRNGNTGQAGASSANAGGMLFGQIGSISGDTMTVTDNNGKQTQVKVSGTTLIQKQASVKLADLSQGETVMVSGNKASDGSLMARSVQVVPAGRVGGPGAADQNSGATTNGAGANAQGPQDGPMPDDAGGPPPAPPAN